MGGSFGFGWWFQAARLDLRLVFWLTVEMKGECTANRHPQAWHSVLCCLWVDAQPYPPLVKKGEQRERGWKKNLFAKVLGHSWPRLVLFLLSSAHFFPSASSWDRLWETSPFWRLPRLNLLVSQEIPPPVTFTLPSTFNGDGQKGVCDRYLPNNHSNTLGRMMWLSAFTSSIARLCGSLRILSGDWRSPWLGSHGSSYQPYCFSQLFQIHFRRLSLNASRTELDCHTESSPSSLFSHQLHCIAGQSISVGYLLPMEPPFCHLK